MVSQVVNHSMTKSTRATWFEARDGGGEQLKCDRVRDSLGMYAVIPSVKQFEARYPTDSVQFNMNHPTLPGITVHSMTCESGETFCRIYMIARSQVTTACPSCRNQGAKSLFMWLPPSQKYRFDKSTSLFSNLCCYPSNWFKSLGLLAMIEIKAK